MPGDQRKPGIGELDAQAVQDVLTSVAGCLRERGGDPCDRQNGRMITRALEGYDGNIPF
jgi:hypothetical protein